MSVGFVIAYRLYLLLSGLLLGLPFFSPFRLLSVVRLFLGMGNSRIGITIVLFSPALVIVCTGGRIIFSYPGPVIIFFPSLLLPLPPPSPGPFPFYPPRSYIRRRFPRFPLIFRISFPSSPFRFFPRLVPPFRFFSVLSFVAPFFTAPFFPAPLFPAPLFPALFFIAPFRL